MQNEPLRVGIVDSALPAATVGLAASADFGATPAESRSAELPLHGQQVVEAISSTDDNIALYCAAVFDQSLTCSAQQVAEALHWLCEREVRIVNMSFGLRENRAVLKRACARALDQGIILIAASPARGGRCFPAAYPGVLSATGDARCAPGEISHLGSAQADFGGHAGDPKSGFAGASSGCAFVTRAAIRLLREFPLTSRQALFEHLARQACHQGTERRSTGPTTVEALR